MACIQRSVSRTNIRRRLFYVSFIAYCYGYCRRLGYFATNTHEREPAYHRISRCAGWAECAEAPKKKTTTGNRIPNPKSKRHAHTHTRQNGKFCDQKDPFHVWFDTVFSAVCVWCVSEMCHYHRCGPSSSSATTATLFPSHLHSIFGSSVRHMPTILCMRYRA